MVSNRRESASEEEGMNQQGFEGALDGLGRETRVPDPAEEPGKGARRGGDGAENVTLRELGEQVSAGLGADPAGRARDLLMFCALKALSTMAVDIHAFKPYRIDADTRALSAAAAALQTATSL